MTERNPACPPGSVAGFPWSASLAFGLGVLRLPPAQFWALTPRELLALATPPRLSPGGAAPDRTVLDALIDRFPDKRTVASEAEDQCRTP